MNLKSAVLSISAVISMSYLTGCASILNDDTQNVNVNTSTGETVDVSIDGVNYKAPGVIAIKRQNRDKILVTEADNCATQTVANKSVDNKFFINILSGGAFGSSTDYSTEKMWKYDDTITINCKEKQQ
ncbi:MAG: adenosine deaminase [Gammaproteobacteria bacterium]|nr:adenosine deaminase [Gammaproteobacteria bacterium]